MICSQKERAHKWMCEATAVASTMPSWSWLCWGMRAVSALTDASSRLLGFLLATSNRQLLREKGSHGTLLPLGAFNGGSHNLSLIKIIFHMEQHHEVMILVSPFFCLCKHFFF